MKLSKFPEWFAGTRIGRAVLTDMERDARATISNNAVRDGYDRTRRAASSSMGIQKQRPEC